MYKSLLLVRCYRLLTPKRNLEFLAVPPGSPAPSPGNARICSGVCGRADSGHFINTEPSKRGPTARRAVAGVSARPPFHVGVTFGRADGPRAFVPAAGDRVVSTPGSGERRGRERARSSLRVRHVPISRGCTPRNEISGSRGDRVTCRGAAGPRSGAAAPPLWGSVTRSLCAGAVGPLGVFFWGGIRSNPFPFFNSCFYHES